MGTLQDGLLKADIASVKQHREIDALRQLGEEFELARRAQPEKEKQKRLGILQATSSPDAFRREARRLLLIEPGLVQEVLNIAHAQGMHGKREKGGTRLIANLYQVKEAFQQKGLSGEDKKSLVGKLFSKK